MNAERARGGLGFWLWWVLASAMGLVLGAVVGGALVDIFPSVLGGAISGVAVGSAVGTSQWLVLRKQLSQVGWWVIASIAGFAMFGAVATVLSEKVSIVFLFALIGAAIGVAQWLVLRPHFSQAGWWVLANVSAFSSFGVAVDAVYAIKGESASLAVSLVVLSIYGGLTGAALVWLLRQPMPEA